MRFRDLPAFLQGPLTAAIGLTFVGLLFFWFPSAAMRANEARGWPVWHTPATRIAGALLMAGGATVLLACSNLFRRIGRGTPVPVAPPERLVLSGLYRYSRNPMYVADVAILLGAFLFFGHAALLLYAVACAAALHAWIVLWEEPVLKRRFGEAYERYTRAVPRWVRLRSPEAGS